MEPRHFLPQAQLPIGFGYPASYLSFVQDNCTSPVAMLGMPPWIFAADLSWAANESVSVFGIPLIPFAQAESCDLVAYFVATECVNPSVVVANPWEPNEKFRYYEEMPDFSSWLQFARAFSESFLVDKPHYRNKPFWFPGAGRVA